MRPPDYILIEQSWRKKLQPPPPPPDLTKLLGSPPQLPNVTWRLPNRSTALPPQMQVPQQELNIRKLLAKASLESLPPGVKEFVSAWLAAGNLAIGSRFGALIYDLLQGKNPLQRERQYQELVSAAYETSPFAAALGEYGTLGVGAAAGAAASGLTRQTLLKTGLGALGGAAGSALLGGDPVKGALAGAIMPHVPVKSLGYGALMGAAVGVPTAILHGQEAGMYAAAVGFGAGIMADVLAPYMKRAAELGRLDEFKKILDETRGAKSLEDALRRIRDLFKPGGQPSGGGDVVKSGGDVVDYFKRLYEDKLAEYEQQLYKLDIDQLEAERRRLQEWLRYYLEQKKPHTDAPPRYEIEDRLRILENVLRTRSDVIDMRDLSRASLTMPPGPPPGPRADPRVAEFLQQLRQAKTLEDLQKLKIPEDLPDDLRRYVEEAYFRRFRALEQSPLRNLRTEIQRAETLDDLERIRQRLAELEMKMDTKDFEELMKLWQIRRDRILRGEVDVLWRPRRERSQPQPKPPEPSGEPPQPPQPPPKPPEQPPPPPEPKPAGTPELPVREEPQIQPPQPPRPPGRRGALQPPRRGRGGEGGGEVDVGQGQVAIVRPRPEPPIPREAPEPPRGQPRLREGGQKTGGNSQKTGDSDTQKNDNTTKTRDQDTQNVNRDQNTQNTNRQDSQTVNTTRQETQTQTQTTQATYANAATASALSALASSLQSLSRLIERLPWPWPQLLEMPPEVVLQILNMPLAAAGRLLGWPLPPGASPRETLADYLGRRFGGGWERGVLARQREVWELI